jgi:branched-subunit amino acid transport protein
MGNLRDVNSTLHIFLSRRLPEWLRQWLDFIPAAVLSALILPALVTTGEPRYLTVFQSALLVSIPTLTFAWKTRSLAGTVIIGMALFWVAGRFFS